MTPETEPRTALRGIALVLLAMLLFAVMDGVNKHLAKTYSFVQILWVRYLLLVVVAALASRGTGVRRALVSRQRGTQIARSLVLVAEQATFIIAFIHLPLADVHALAAVSPLIVTLLSAPLLRERVSLYRMLAVAAGFAGVLLILRPGTGAMSAEAAIPLLAALLWAVYQMLTRLASRTDRPETSLLYAGLAGAVRPQPGGPLLLAAAGARGLGPAGAGGRAQRHRPFLADQGFALRGGFGAAAVRLLPVPVGGRRRLRRFRGLPRRLDPGRGGGHPGEQPLRGAPHPVRGRIPAFPRLKHLPPGR